MARVKLSALLQSITGRYGGGVFRTWKGIPVLSSLPETVHNPNTVLQAKARELLTFCSKVWSALEWSVKDEWSQVADYLTGQWETFDNEVGSATVIKTPRGPFTGLDAIVSAHSLLGSVDAWTSADALIEAPTGVSAPSQPTSLDISGDTDGIVCTWTDPASWGDNGSAGHVRLWAKSEDGTYFAQLAGFAAAAAETFTITELRPSGGSGPVALKPGPYFVQADAVNAEGLRSGPSAVARILLEEPGV